MAIKRTENVYEVSVHCAPTLEEPAVEEKIAALKKVIDEAGSVISEEAAQKINLAYTIRHNVRRSDGVYDRYNESYFGSIKFRAPQSSVRAVHEALQGDDQVIRFIILETVDENTRIGPVLPGEEEEADSEKKQEKKEGEGEKEKEPA